MDLESLMANVDHSNMYVTQQTLCNTLSGNPVPLLTITSLPQYDEDSKAAIFEMSKSDHKEHKKTFKIK